MNRLNKLVGLVAFVGEFALDTIDRGLANLAHPQAFVDDNLSLIGNAGVSQAPRIWGYKTDDIHAVVDTAAYFNNASDRLKVGDILHVVVVTNLDASNEAVATYGTHIVLSNAAGVVDVSDVTVGTVTDTD